MPYISKENVKEIRNRIKKANPEFKFSITSDYNSISVVILEGPIEINEKYMSINHFYYKEHHADEPELVKLIDNIMDCINGVNRATISVVDSDYGAVPSYYKHISVGKWDRCYKRIER